MRNSAIVLAVLVAAFALAVPASLATPLQATAGGKATLRYKGILTSHEVTNGGVAATGRFTASGAITDKGTFKDYRTQKGMTIRIRRVTVGKKGTIVFVITIDTSGGGDKGWTIASGTKSYKGLHGKGIEAGGVTGNALNVTMKGTVIR